MWASAAAALGRAALGRAATRKGRVVMVALILAGAIVMVPFLTMLAFFSVTVHVLKGVAVAPPGYLAIDAYRAAEECPFTTGGEVGTALGTAFLIGSAWVMTGDGAPGTKGHNQFGGYRNPVGQLSNVPPDMRPADPAELGPTGAVHIDLQLPDTRTVQPQDWTSVAPLSGEYGAGLLLITPSDWRSWSRDVPASVARPLDPYQPYDAFMVMACHLRALEKSDGVDAWGALALWTVTQVLSADLNHALSSATNAVQIAENVVAEVKALLGSGVSLSSEFVSAVASFMGSDAMGLDGLAMGQVLPSALALQTIPPNYLQLIRKWAAAYGIDWTVLAGLLKVEDDFGRGSGRSSAGALGPAQFLPSTFARYGVDDPSDGKTDAPDIWNPADAIASAANFLKALGAGNPATVRAALCSYNTGGPASSQYQPCMDGTQKPVDYADAVMSYARQYRGATIAQTAAAVGSKGQVAIAAAIAFATAQLGKPYVFGATGPNSWDCSGLVQAAYRAAGISLPRTSQAQFAFGPRVAPPPQRGDLVFFVGADGTPSAPGHVGLAIDSTHMIVAPQTGELVQIQTIYPGVVGVTRPALLA